MAFSKAHHFDPADYYFSLLCHALAHPARISIIRKLSEKEKLFVWQLKRGIILSDAAFSQHLKLLRSLQIVCCEQEHASISYWLNDSLPKTAHNLILLLLNIDEKKFRESLNELGLISHRRIVPVDGL